MTTLLQYQAVASFKRAIILTNKNAKNVQTNVNNISIHYKFKNLKSHLHYKMET